MRRLALMLIALLFASVACSYPGVIPTPTPIPSRAPTLASVPTLVPSNTPLPVTPTKISLPTSTPLKLSGVPAAAPVGVPSNAVAMSGGPVNPSFQAQFVTVGNAVLLLPDKNAGLPLDFDANAKGQRVTIDGNGQMLLNGAPYTANGKHAGKRFLQTRWSPDGRWLAYLVMTPDAEKGQLGWQATLDDGLWLVDTSRPNATPDFIMRNHYDAPNDTSLRLAYDINWASDNDAMLVGVRRPKGNGTILVGKSIRANDQAPGLFDVLPYLGATWQPDAQSFVAASPADLGVSRITVVQRDVGKTQVIADGAGTHLWMQNPAQVPDGRYLFLGKPSDSGRLEGAAEGLALYGMWSGQAPAQISQPLPGEVLAALWNPARTSLLVILRNDQGVQTKVVSIDGSVVDYSEQAQGGTSAHWAR